MDDQKITHNHIVERYHLLEIVTDPIQPVFASHQDKYRCGKQEDVNVETDIGTGM
jgi:hypothetical protein